MMEMRRKRPDIIQENVFLSGPGINEELPYSGDIKITTKYSTIHPRANFSQLNKIFLFKKRSKIPIGINAIARANRETRKPVKLRRKYTSKIIKTEVSSTNLSHILFISLFYHLSAY